MRLGGNLLVPFAKSQANKVLLLIAFGVLSRSLATNYGYRIAKTPLATRSCRLNALCRINLNSNALPYLSLARCCQIWQHPTVYQVRMSINSGTTPSMMAMVAPAFCFSIPSTLDSLETYLEFPSSSNNAARHLYEHG